MPIKTASISSSVCLGMLLGIGLLLSIPSAGRAQRGDTLIAYPTPPGLKASSDFAVKVDGKDVWTEQVGGEGKEALHVANFSCAGPHTVTISAPTEIGKFIIRPKNLGIAAKVSGRTLTFTIPGPQKLYIEIGDLPHLAIFANPLEANPPKPDDPAVKYFGPGAHEVAELRLQNDQTIYIAGGAVVNAKSVTADNVHNARILGRGVLNVDSGVNLLQSANIEINGIFIRLAGSVPVNAIQNSENITYRNVKVFSYRELRGADGIDPISSKNVTIDDCFIRTRGNCIAITSPQGGPVDGITVMHSVLAGWAYGDGITMGFELKGPVQNVLIKDCDILYSGGQQDTGGHSALSIVCNDAGAVSNIRYEDIRVEESQAMKNFELNITEGQRNGSRNGPGSINGVYLKNVSWENPRRPFVLGGIPTQGGHFVTDVTFDNCRVGGKLLINIADADFRAEFARDIKFIPSGPTTKRIISNE